MIIVGSWALAQWNLHRKPPKDFDLWLKESEVNTYPEKADIYIVSKELHDMIPTVGNYPTPDALYTIKCSHLAWDIHWDKTKLDIIHLESKGCKLIPELYLALKARWVKDYGDKNFLSLKKNKKDFFTDKVYYKYDHDYLHELVAHPNPPMYTKCLVEGEEVLIDKHKWDMLQFPEQIRMFREEMAVIACERWLLNDKNSVTSWSTAYKMALKKTITTLTKGWATDFIITNLKYFIKPEYSYFESILTTLEDNMSKVDLTVFEELKESLGYDDLKELVYALCENGIDWGNDYDFENEYPEWGVKNEDPTLYEKLRKAYQKEHEQKYKPYVEYKKGQWDYEHLEQEGGGEGGAEDCYGVFKLQGKIYRAEYDYYSHNGHEYDYIVDTLTEVHPVQKTITVYE